VAKKKVSSNPNGTAAAGKKSPKPRTDLTMDAATAEEEFKAFAAMVTSPSFAAMRVPRVGEQQTVADQLDWPILIRTLRDQGRAVTGGNLAQAEGMLINAVALQSLFARLVERGMAAATRSTPTRSGSGMMSPPDRLVLVLLRELYFGRNLKHFVWDTHVRFQVSEEHED
jgi:hypothetical protein